jgi:hypothetical protein
MSTTLYVDINSYLGIHTEKMLSVQLTPLKMHNDVRQYKHSICPDLHDHLCTVLAYAAMVCHITS